MSEEQGRPILSSVFETAIPFLLRALTPLHPGSGARVSGLVDLPIQREAHTDLPVIYASSLKGALRAWARAMNLLDDRALLEIFGPEPGQGDKGMGKAVFMDAKLLLLPVRSLKGIYGWITSPFLLERFRRDMGIVKELTGVKAGMDLGDLNLEVRKEAALGSSSNGLKFKLEGKDVVVIEDMILEFESVELSFLGSLVEKVEKGIVNRILVVHDDTFKRLLKRSLEVTPHIAINHDTGTVQNLWFQENLPAETVMYSVAFTAKDLKDKLEKALEGVVHVGGDITTGLGFARIHTI